MTRIRRILAALAALAGALVATTAAAPAALAVNVPPPGGAPSPPPAAPGPAPAIPWLKTPAAPPQVHTVVVGGMPGWQIALIAAGAALAAAALAVLLDRTRAARKVHATTA